MFAKVPRASCEGREGKKNKVKAAKITTHTRSNILSDLTPTDVHRLAHLKLTAGSLWA
jgi:hypothetical protein